MYQRRRRGRSGLTQSRSRGTWLLSIYVLYERGSCFAICGACCGVACNCFLAGGSYGIDALLPLYRACARSTARSLLQAVAWAAKMGEPRGHRKNLSHHPCACYGAPPCTASRSLALFEPRVRGAPAQKRQGHDSFTRAVKHHPSQKQPVYTSGI